MSGLHLELDPAGYLVLRLFPVALSRARLTLSALLDCGQYVEHLTGISPCLIFLVYRKKVFPALRPATSDQDFPSLPAPPSIFFLFLF